MNRDKSSFPKSRAWWRRHLLTREISQAENKTESLSKLNFPLASPFDTAILSDTILFYFVVNRCTNATIFPRGGK